MKILITGSSGAIGTELVPFLLDRGHSLVALSRKEITFQHSQLINIRMDLNELGASNSTITYYDPSIKSQFLSAMENVDTILHFSGIASGEGITPFDYHNGNTRSVDILVKISKIYNIKKFIYASSASVYGMSGEGTRAKVTFPLMGETNYALSKIKGECILMDSEVPNKIILRLASVYGNNFKSFINKLLLLRNKKFCPYPINIEKKKSFLYYKDLLFFVNHLLDYEKSGIFNLAHPEALSIGEVLRIMDEVDGKSPFKIPIPYLLYWTEKNLRKFITSGRDPLLKPLFHSILLDTDETIKNLGYIPIYDLRSGLLEMTKSRFL